MPVIRPIRELQNTTEISHFAKTLNEPIFITKNGRNDLVLMNDAVYERIMAQNEMYRWLLLRQKLLMEQSCWTVWKY